LYFIFNINGCAGTLWFPNLTVPDPFFILPAIVGLSFAANIFISSNRLVPAVAAPTSRLSRGLTFLLYGLAAAMVPITAMQPAAVSLYWATSGCLGTVFNLLLVSPRFKRLVRIPRTHMDPDRPYQVLRSKLLALVKKGDLNAKLIFIQFPRHC
jgi:membrane protein insertase Oxa1/YidC/SpoIIIJ